ncbi:serine/threonine-protein kinase, partial [Actinotalea sp. JY-7885]
MERIEVTPGTEIGGYRVIGPLGRGGMGAVYRAADGDGATVALKLLHPHLGADPDARERLQREVRHLQRIRHPGVARVLDAEIDSTEAFVVTELVDGQDLGAHVTARGPLPPGELADLAERLHDAIAVVHEAGVLHRDLTPGNVMVTSRGPVLIDFGIAQAVDDVRVTSTGLVMGTPGYLSPELLDGAEPSESGDWWGWAALLTLAATGRPPFGGPPLQAVLSRARTGQPDLDGLAPRTAAALRGALAVDPWRRTEPEEVVAELRRAAQGDTDAPATAGATAVLGVPGAGRDTGEGVPATAVVAAPAGA